MFKWVRNTPLKQPIYTLGLSPRVYKKRRLLGAWISILLQPIYGKAGVAHLAIALYTNYIVGLFCYPLARQNTSMARGLRPLAIDGLLLVGVEPLLAAAQII